MLGKNGRNRCFAERMVLVREQSRCPLATGSVADAQHSGKGLVGRFAAEGVALSGLALPRHLPLAIQFARSGGV
jgi:hypothetical protein